MAGRLIQLALRALDKAAGWRSRPPTAPPHLLTGRSGEEEAYFYLRRQGYTMVARNFRSPRYHGEIDLIGWDGDVLCFVEVKTRSTRDVKPAEAAVDTAKRQELAAVAGEYLRRLDRRPAFRFDVVSIYGEPAQAPEINLYKNAFSMS